MATDWGRVARLGAVGAAVAGSVAAGIAVQRAITGRVPEHDPEANEVFGGLRVAGRTITADDGVELHVEVDEIAAGSRGDDGLTIIFCHGFALHLDSFHYQRRDLRSLGRLVFWDQRSHGGSGRSSPEHSIIEQLGRDLTAVIDATAPTGPIVLVGHSMGGMTVMAYAAAHPEVFGDRVRGVLLLATSANGISGVAFGMPSMLARPLHRFIPGAAAALARRMEFVEAVRRSGATIGAYLTARLSFGSRVSEAVADFAHDMIEDTGIDVIAEFLPTFETHDLRSSLGPFGSVDTVVVVGAEDRLTPPELSREMVRYIPNADLVVMPETGHLVQLERYAEVNDLIRSLVRRVRVQLAHDAEDSRGA